MSDPTAPAPRSSVGFFEDCLWMAGAVISFTLAYDINSSGVLIFAFLFCLLKLAQLGTRRSAFYFGLVVGTLSYAIQLSFFYRLFGLAAIVLWLILGLWLGLFLLLARLCLSQFRPLIAVGLIPFVWTGLEYFRSELYYLRFSWLNIGFALSNGWLPAPFQTLGVYGTGFLAVALVGTICLLPRKMNLWGGLLLAGIWIGTGAFDRLDHAHPPKGSPGQVIHIAGVQMEFPSETDVLFNLNKVIKEFPQTDLIVLSEYTFDGTVPDSVKAWCQINQKYLIAGGKDPAPGTNYFNTAFVVDPSGEIIFRQAKSVPIQFFKDGLPAPGQDLWRSPWGPIGICICYDLSYRRVTDRLIELGAQALIVPTMDVEDWGRHEHELHQRVALVRGAEYHIPIFRVASSGISQSVDEFGRLRAAAPMPGNSATLSSELKLGRTGRVPFDRVIAPVSVGVTGILTIWLAFKSVLKRKPGPMPLDSKI